MKRCSIVVLLFFTLQGYAQTDYVITTQQDTIHGKIEILLPADTHEEISIQTDGENRKLKAFQFIEFTKDSTLYRAVKLTNLYRIMKVEKDGYLSLLTFRPDGNYTFGAKYLQKKTGEGIEVPTLLFKKVMMDFLRDCNEVAEKIDDKTYKKNDLDEIVSAYNKCISGQTQALYSDIPKQETMKSPASKKLEQLRDKLKDVDQSQVADLQVLLRDIAQKLAKGEDVPSYMISALKEQSTKVTSLRDEISELAELLD